MPAEKCEHHWKTCSETFTLTLVDMHSPSIHDLEEFQKFCQFLIHKLISPSQAR